jgi:hypothetical protein
MGFASAWLDERALFPELFGEKPDNEIGIIVVVPAFNEPGIVNLLDSLKKCTAPDCATEVIIIVNAPRDASDECIDNNRKCVDNINSWRDANNDCVFRLLVFNTGQSEIKEWGVGLSRKTGMDEALRRFSRIDNPDGVIVCLDADCTVEANYFISIYEGLAKNKSLNACSVYFEHSISGTEFPPEIYNYIILYELHLRYYLQGIKYSGFPYPFHTVGSAIAVKASAYMKSGGMNRRQAGEDFYFIQKLVQFGGYFALNTTTVYPSPRESYRVPFGTGASMSRMMRNSDTQLLTYNFKAFIELRTLFASVATFYRSDDEVFAEQYKMLPEGIRSYLSFEEIAGKIAEIRSNTSGADAFSKRFFAWFNMFRVVKYLNFIHESHFRKQSVTEAVTEFLRYSGNCGKFTEPVELLICLRKMEKPQML